jgi:hypothetical protein
MPAIVYVLLVATAVPAAALTWFFYRSDAAYDGDEDLPPSPAND